MSLKKEGYTKRLIDEKINIYLKLFGAISIEGPKWCGKTWTSLNHANSVKYLTEDSVRNNALNNPKLIFEDKKPELIDEWQLAPNIWDAIRHECDEDHNKGKFILTASTTLQHEDESEVFHSGAGRIATMHMFPMSLYESHDSSGKASIMDMYNGVLNDAKDKEVDLEYLAYLIVRGGWPENLNVDKEYCHIIPSSYIDSILKKDIHERKDRRRDQDKMAALLRSLARNESSMIGVQTIVSDMEKFETNEKIIKDRETVNDYLSALNDLYLISDQQAYGLNYRSSGRVGKSPKRHLIDPSLSCASLGITQEKLLNDHASFGLYFEALVERDLKIYMDYLEGNLYHFKDNQSGDEVDAILEFKDGEYAAVEIKLSFKSINDGINSLVKFYSGVKKKPKFMCVIVGNQSAIYQDKETGIYVVPITSLMP